PSLVLSSFNPVSVLKGERSGPRGAAFRKILVVAQFTLSAFFLIATGVVLRQLTYIQEKRLGFNEEQLIVIPMTHPSLHERTESIKAELLRHPSIVSVAATANLPGGGDWGIPYVPAGIPPEQIPPMRILVGDQDLITTLQIPLAQGRVFSRAIATDSTAAWIINEEAARQLGWEDPLQHRIAMPAVNRASAPVIGVVKDFHFRSLREKIVPILVMVPPREWLTSFAVRVRPGDVTETLAYLERQFKEYDPQHPFRYSFLDEQFSNLHASEQRMGHLLTVTSVLAIVLACLGLFGLAAFSAEIRTKEIGVRKVMGASLPGIVGLMTRDFMKLVFVANVLAWPLGYYAMTLWLESFAYRTDVSPWIFAATTLLAFVIAALTVSVQAVRAGLANPVEALRYE
ncbi:MAG TPA: FtsX-like permease family protein, partial [Bacteroidota bacterium]|nr:FtsX-like permease family protein [Bacteroidota bacterium]